MISLDTKGFATRLARIDFAATERDALEAAAAQIEDSVKQTLSHSQENDHDTPWMETGRLRDSITHTVGTGTVTIGSSDVAAVAQEFGTRHVPPRPFLAPSAAAIGEEVAMQSGALVAQALRGT